MKLGFDEGLQRLEEIVKKLEAGGTSLEETLKLFEEGMKLHRELQEQLERIKEKVVLIMKGDSGVVMQDASRLVEEIEKKGKNG